MKESLEMILCHSAKAVRQPDFLCGSGGNTVVELRMEMIFDFFKVTEVPRRYF